VKPPDIFFDIRTFTWYDSVEKRDGVSNYRGHTLATRCRNGLKAGVCLRVELKCAADHIHGPKDTGMAGG
jgi:hypothetical protein